MRYWWGLLICLVFSGVAQAQQVSNPVPFNQYKGVSTSQTATGTWPTGTPVVLNSFVINSDDAAISGDTFPHTSGPFHNAFHVEHNFGGAAMIGGVNSLTSDAVFKAATSPSNWNRNYVSLAGVMTVETGDGGTNTLGWAEPGGDSKGGWFGLWVNNSIRPWVKNAMSVTGAELNIGVEAGATGWLKEIVTIAPETIDEAVFTHNFMLTLSSKSSHRTYDAGISFNNFHGAIPITQIGSLINVDGHPATPVVLQVGRAFDFRRIDFIDHLVEWCNLTSGTPLICNSTSWINARKSQMKLVHNPEQDGAGGTITGEPTYFGDIRYIGTSQTTGNADANGGLEFKISPGGGGYGFRFYPLGAAGEVNFLVQRRFNSAAWVTSWSILGSGTIVHDDPTNFNALATFNGAAVHNGVGVFNASVAFNAVAGFTGSNVGFGPSTPVGIQGDLGVGGSANFAGPAGFTGLTVDFGPSTTVSVQGNLGVGGLVVDGPGSFDSPVSFNDIVGFTGSAVNFGSLTSVGFAGNIGVAGSTTLSGAVAVNNTFNLMPVPAPGSPGVGWILYTDSSDGGKLKAKAAGSGVVVVLGTP